MTSQEAKDLLNEVLQKMKSAVNNDPRVNMSQLPAEP